MKNYSYIKLSSFHPLVSNKISNPSNAFEVASLIKYEELLLVIFGVIQSI